MLCYVRPGFLFSLSFFRFLTLISFELTTFFLFFFLTSLRQLELLSSDSRMDIDRRMTRI